MERPAFDGQAAPRDESVAYSPHGEGLGRSMGEREKARTSRLKVNLFPEINRGIRGGQPLVQEFCRNLLN